jgi:hypothetical protein
MDPKYLIGQAPDEVEKFTRPGGPVLKALEPYREHMTNKDEEGVNENFNTLEAFSNLHVSDVRYA